MTKQKFGAHTSISPLMEQLIHFAWLWNMTLSINLLHTEYISQAQKLIPTVQVILISFPFHFFH